MAIEVVIHQKQDGFQEFDLVGLDLQQPGQSSPDRLCTHIEEALGRHIAPENVHGAFTQGNTIVVSYVADNKGSAAYIHVIDGIKQYIAEYNRNNHGHFDHEVLSRLASWPTI